MHLIFDGGKDAIGFFCKSVTDFFVNDLIKSGIIFAWICSPGPANKATVLGPCRLSSATPVYEVSLPSHSNGRLNDWGVFCPVVSSCAWKPCLYQQLNSSILLESNVLQQLKWKKIDQWMVVYVFRSKEAFRATVVVVVFFIGQFPVSALWVT